MNANILHTPSAFDKEEDLNYVTVDSPPKAPVRSRSSAQLTVLELETTEAVPMFRAPYLPHENMDSIPRLDDASSYVDPIQRNDTVNDREATTEGSMRPLCAVLKFPSFVFHEDRNDNAIGSIVNSSITQILPQKRPRDRSTSLDSKNMRQVEGYVTPRSSSADELQFPVLKEQIRFESDSRSLRPRRRVLSDSSIDVAHLMSGNFHSLSIETPSAKHCHRSYQYNALFNRHPLHNLEEENTSNEETFEYETPHTSPAPLFSYQAL